MANEVKITLAAETTDFQKEMAKAEDATKDASLAFQDLDKRSRSASDGFKKSGDRMGSSFDRISDGADRGEQRIVGMRDGITGTKDLMEGWRTGSMELVLTGLADLASSVANFAGPVLGKMAAALKLNVAWTKLQAGAQKILNAVMGANPYVKIALLIFALVGAFIAAYKESETFRGIVQDVMEKIRPFIDGVKDAIGFVVEAVVDAYRSSAWQGIQNTVKTIFVTYIKAYIEVVSTAIGAIITAVNAVRNWGGWNVVKSFMQGIWDGIKGFISGVSTAIGAIIDAVNAVRNWGGWEVLKDALGKIWGGISKGVGAVGDAIGAIIDAAIKVKDWKGWDTVGDVIKRVFGGIKDIINGVKDVIEEVIKKIEWAIDKAGDLKDKVGGVFEKIGGLGGSAKKRNANGGLVTRPSIAGEAGPELVLPLTRPKRMNELMNQYLGPSGPMVNVEQMVVQDATDVYRVSSQLGRQLRMAG